MVQRLNHHQYQKDQQRIQQPLQQKLLIIKSASIHLLRNVMTENLLC
tara:strand:+ start:135 stop:275 length:141 start_codon:yes stop_codon:yes gene_type:complete